MKKKLQIAVMALLFASSVKSQTASCLNFDGSGSYVNCGNILTSSYTKEAWVNINTTGTNNNMISGGAAGQHAFWAPVGYGYKLSAGHNGGWNQVQDPTPLTAGVWYHVAVSYDATSGTFVLYKNGVVVSTSTGNPGYNGGNLLLLGAYDPGSNLYNGTMDEVRIWNYVRSAADIQANMNCELNYGASQPGLIAYYNFNEGVASAANPTVTTLFDLSGNNLNGTLNSFALTGPTSNWISGSPVLTVPSLTVSGTNTLCAGGTVTQMVSGGTSYTWSTGSNSTAISVTPSVSTLYTVAAVGSNTCVNTIQAPVYVNLVPMTSASTTSTIICSGQSPTLTAMPGASYGLSFNGSGAYVDVSTNVNIPVNNSIYTLEAWIKPTSAGVSGIVGWGSWGSGNQVNALRLNGPNQIINYWWGNDLVVNCPNVVDGFWHHIAATFDGTTRKIYMDGILLGRDTPSGHNVPFSNNMEIGCTNNTTEFFTGEIDDVRIWNIARTQLDIVGNMNNCLLGTEAGLVSFYSMNNGTGSSVLSDLSVNANNGTLVGMNPATDWTAGYNNCNPGYLWTPSAATTQSVVVTPSVTTVYTVNVTAFNGCAASATKMIIVDTPTLSITGVNSICAGNSATLAGSGATTYTWNTSATTTTISVSPTITTTYSLAGTSATGCTSSVSAVHTVTVNALPTLTISGTYSLCAGSTITQTVSGASTYTWSTGSNTNVISFTPTATATYSVNATDVNGCMGSAVETITVNSLPTVSVVTSNSLLCTGQTATLTASGATTYTWSTSASTAAIPVTPTLTTSYTVTGTGANGCSKQSVITQSVSTCIGIAEPEAAGTISIYPNPNNGTFNVNIGTANGNTELIILNTLGQKVYSQIIVEGTNVIGTTGLAKGLYQYIILNDQKASGAGKLIIE